MILFQRLPQLKFWSRQMILATEIQKGRLQSKLYPFVYRFDYNKNYIKLHTCFCVAHNIQLLLHRKLNLLSFGEEAEEEEKELAAVKVKIRSSHDVLDDPRLLKEDGSTGKLVLINFYHYTSVLYQTSMVVA